MRLILNSTSQIVQLQAQNEDSPVFPARVWEGWTGMNTPVIAFICRLFPPIDADDPRQMEFIRELQQADEPRLPAIKIPPRLIL